MDQSAHPTYSPTEFRPLTFHDAVPRFRDGSDTPRAYLERCLETIAQREPVVQAFASLNEEAAREAADAATARYRAGQPLSPIDGMPVGIKDLIETRDLPTEMGSPMFKGNRPGRDSALVQALREAGAIILGKTVTTELGMSHPGPTRNPFDPRRTPGGSSSGSGAAVGACMVPVAIGTQVIGSVIRPASFCANRALKPTQGALNRGERQGLSQSTVGVHAGSLEDMWAVAVEIARRAGGDPGAPGLFFTGEELAAPARPRRLAVLETEGWAEVTPQTRAAFDQVVAALQAQGVTVIRRGDHPLLEALEQRLTDAMGLARDVCAFEMRWSVANMVAKDPAGISDSLKARMELGRSITLEEYRLRLLQRAEMRAALAAMAGEVDAFIGPASCGPAPLPGDTGGSSGAILHTTGNPAMNAASSGLGAPVVTIPLMAVQGMPVGLQVTGQQHADERVAAIARWIERTIAPQVVE